MTREGAIAHPASIEASAASSWTDDILIKREFRRIHPSANGGIRARGGRRSCRLPQPGGHCSERPPRRCTWRCGTASPPSEPLLITKRNPLVKPS